jgi:hypothetical protein
MTREQIKEYLPLLQAFAEGKPLQRLSKDEWIDVLADIG